MIEKMACGEVSFIAFVQTWQRVEDGQRQRRSLITANVNPKSSRVLRRSMSKR